MNLSQGLIAPFTDVEIEDVVSSFDGNKSLGPDGFNFSFVKANWHLLKGEVGISFREFHANDWLPKGFT